MSAVPYVLLVLAAAGVVRCGWGWRETVPVGPAAATGVLLVAFLVSTAIVHRDEEPSTSRYHASATDTPTPTTLLTGSDVPTGVAGESLNRDEFERLQTCEAALAEIAATVAGTPHTTDDVPSLIADPEAGSDSERGRLSRCELRLSAIAATVEP